MWLGSITRRGVSPPKELAAAVRAFVREVPRVTQLRRILDKEFSLSGAGLPELDPRVDGGESLRAAKGRDYLMPGGVNLPRALKAVAALTPALAAARANLLSDGESRA